jgi:hypothetical protein
LLAERSGVHSQPITHENTKIGSRMTHSSPFVLDHPTPGRSAMSGQISNRMTLSSYSSPPTSKDASNIIRKRLEKAMKSRTKEAASSS